MHFVSFLSVFYLHELIRSLRPALTYICNFVLVSKKLISRAGKPTFWETILGF